MPLQPIRHAFSTTHRQSLKIPACAPPWLLKLISLARFEQETCFSFLNLFPPQLQRWVTHRSASIQLWDLHNIPNNASLVALLLLLQKSDRIGFRRVHSRRWWHSSKVASPIPSSSETIPFQFPLSISDGWIFSKAVILSWSTADCPFSLVITAIGWFRYQSPISFLQNIKPRGLLTSHFPLPKSLANNLGMLRPLSAPPDLKYVHKDHCGTNLLRLQSLYWRINQLHWTAYFSIATIQHIFCRASMPFMRSLSRGSKSCFTLIRACTTSISFSSSFVNSFSKFLTQALWSFKLLISDSFSNALLFFFFPVLLIPGLHFWLSLFLKAL